VNERFASLGRLLHRIEARHGPAQWVAISDTDEFWWQPGNGLASLLASVPAGVVGVNAAQKLFLPTALDPTAGPCYLRRTWRSTGPASPLHTSYRRGKSMYRASWVRAHEISSAHWCPKVPTMPWRPARPLVHHYMIDDEESFVQKVVALQRWSPEVGKTPLAAEPVSQDAHDAAELRRRFRDFKVEWWRVYSTGGEEAVREYRDSRPRPARRTPAGHRVRRLHARTLNASRGRAGRRQSARSPASTVPSVASRSRNQAFASPPNTTADARISSAKRS
jgi:hypothetical protein